MNFEIFETDYHTKARLDPRIPILCRLGETTKWMKKHRTRPLRHARQHVVQSSPESCLLTGYVLRASSRAMLFAEPHLGCFGAAADPTPRTSVDVSRRVFLGSDGRARAARARERRREPRDDARHCPGDVLKPFVRLVAAFRHPSATSSAVSGASRRCLLGFFRDGVWLPSVARSPALDAAALAFDAPTSTLPIKLTNDRLPCIVFAPTVSPVP